MKPIIVINFSLALILLLAPIFSQADDTVENSTSTLFKIGRSKDANEIYYELNTNADGSLDLEEPIKIHWIKYTKKGRIESLTKIQQLFAYGLKFLELTPEEAAFQFVSYPKRTLKLRKSETGNYGVFIQVDEEEVELKRVFIQIDGGTFWFPKIMRVEVHTGNSQVEDLLVEVINP